MTSRKRKVHALSDADSDSSESAAKKKRQDDDAEVGANDLFGDADDISDSDEEAGGSDRKSPASGSDDEGITKTKAQRDHVISDDDDDDVRRGSDLEREHRSRSRSPEQAEPQEEPAEEEEVVIPETKIEAEIPKINTDLGRQIHFVKLPNFLSVETRPFDRETYEDEIDEEETLDEEGRARLKLKVENTIRWQVNFDSEGNAIRESNAKLVRWSDGSLSMHLGSEIFDVYKQPLQGDHNHLFIRQGTGLQGQAVFRTKLSFRPHSTDSFTHRKILSSLADRSLKTSAVKVLSQVMKDPDIKRDELFKRDEEHLRASMRRQSKQKRVKERAPAKGLTKGYLEGEEEEEDEGAFSISAIKNKVKSKQKERKEKIYSSDSDSDLSDLGPSKSKKSGKRAALTDSEEDGDNASSGGSDSEAGSDRPKSAANSGSDVDKSPEGEQASASDSE